MGKPARRRVRDFKTRKGPNGAVPSVKARPVTGCMGYGEWLVIGVTAEGESCILTESPTREDAEALRVPLLGCERYAKVYVEKLCFWVSDIKEPDPCMEGGQDEPGHGGGASGFPV